MRNVTYGVRKFQASLGKALAAVKRGERVIITSRGRPIAVISRADAIVPGESREEQVLRRLAAEGRLHLGAMGRIAPFKPPRVGGLSAQVRADRR